MTKEIEVNPDLIKSVINEKYLGLMLFGSFARGDNDEFSDIDVLQLTEGTTKRYQIGELNVSTYSRKTLEKMSAEGSLFVLHLLTEGIIIDDKFGELGRILSNFKPMNASDYENFRAKLLRSTKLLDISEATFYQFPLPYLNIASFILRSTLYSILAEADTPIFSIMQASEKLNDKALLILKEQREKKPSFSTFFKMKKLISKYLGFCEINEFETLEALILNCKNKEELTYVLGLRLLRGSGKNEIYSRVQ